MTLYVHNIGFKHYHKTTISEDMVPYSILFNTSNALYYSIAYRNSEVS